MDLIAMKWTKRAVNAITLAARIHKGVCKYTDGTKALKAQPQNKPHGRKTYVLCLGTHGAYIDLSVM
jgi:hypothetical protein